MGVQTRTGGSEYSIGSGPYLAKVVNHLDTTYMGGLEVTIVRSIPGIGTTESTNVTVKYCSPFFGASAQMYEGNDPTSFNDVQKSYGFWFVPPDIGSTVMVMFVDGDINQGYWFGCIPDMYQNHMVPGIAASRYSAMTAAQRQQYNTDYVPVAEYHKSSRTMDNQSPDTFAKPVHPFANRLVEQGLLVDTIRGVTSSSARREVPSRVFGVSTPGPVDVTSPLKQAGFENGGNSFMLPVSRFGGHQLVLDDGDLDGNNELMRFRTRTGHQILLHNSSDLIYIANSKGSAWIEMTSNGKIDIFAADSVSIHTGADFNFRADRDVNIEAVRNVNISAGSGITMQSTDRFYLTCDADGKIQFAGNANISAASQVRVQSGSSLSLISGTDMYLNSAATVNQTAATTWMVAASGSTNITSAHHLETATRIDMNGPQALTAGTGNAADPPVRLETFNMNDKQVWFGWGNGHFYNTGTITSIMQRVPTHEPWDQHENVNPTLYSSTNTDIQVVAPTDFVPNPTASTGTVYVNTTPVATPTSYSTSTNESYLKSVLIQSGVTDPTKLAAWMAQCRVESDGFRALAEYASGAAYEGRTDLGNTSPGDGVKYKGRGFIQCTGKNNYQSMSTYFSQDFINNPQLVQQLEWAAKSVVWFFNVYKSYATGSVDWSNVTAVTKIVNGGTNGLSLRQSAYSYYYNLYTTQGIGS